LALVKIPLAEAVLLRASGPIFVPLIALLVYRQRSSLNVWAGIGLAFVGMAALTGADLKFHWGEVFGILSGLCGGAAAVSMWSMSKEDGADTQMLWFSLLSVACSVAPLWSGVQIPDVILWPDLIAVAVFTLLSQVFMAMGFVAAPANRVISWAYTSAIFSAAIGFVFFNEPLTAAMLIGFALIVGAATCRRDSEVSAQPARTLRGCRAALRSSCAYRHRSDSRHEQVAAPANAPE
jgi:drug/metabolite transporter (DMT)-like permease